MEQHDIEAQEVRYWGTVPATYAEREDQLARYVHYLQSLSPSDFATVTLRVERILPLLHAGSRHTAVTREEAVRRGLFPRWPLPPEVDLDSPFLPD
jgi:hypothetical protein